MDWDLEDGVYTIIKRAETNQGYFCESTQDLVVNRTSVNDAIRFEFIIGVS